MVSNKIKLVLNFRIFFIASIILDTGGYKRADGFFINYTGNSEFIQQRIGQNITLQCSLNGIVDTAKIADVTYNWYFKQCDDKSSEVLKCFNTNDNEDWAHLFSCQDKICKSELHLKNVTQKYSGLYKCTVMPKIGNLLDVKLVRTYQLHIKNSSIKIPEFLDAYPINKTVSKGSQVVFQSRVYSKEYPTIKWFRRLSNTKYSGYENVHSTVYSNGWAYELLKSTREKATSTNVYISKLIINEVHLQDEGFYACVAITFDGHNIREAYLNVYEADHTDDLTEYWSDYSAEDDVLPTDPKEFWLLFLMPVGLALLPLILWFGYIIFKRCQNCNLKDDTQKKIFQENVYKLVAAK